MPKNPIYIKGLVEKVDKQSATITGVASTGSIDRADESVNPDGWMLDNFKANPIMLWSHMSMEPAIGKITDIYISNGALKFNAVFAENDEFAKRIKNLMVDEGVINSFSVGFIPLEFDQHGNILKQELLEISVVNVPCNPEARMSNSYKSFVTDFANDPRIKAENDDKKEVAEKSPACRMDDESKDQCVSRKVKEMMEEGMDQEQAVAAASGMCDTMCEEKSEQKTEEQEKTYIPEDVKNQMRIARDAHKTAIHMIDEILTMAVPNPSKEDTGEASIDDKQKQNGVSREATSLRALRLADKAVELAISQLKKKGGAKL